LSILVVCIFFESFWDKNLSKEIISITKTLLWFSLYYVKNPLFQFSENIICVKKIKDYCLTFHIIIGSWKNSSDEHDLLKSLFRDSGWTECLIHIFNTLNPFSSSSLKELPPFLSFFSFVSLSDITSAILYYTSKSISLLEDENTPKETSKYIKIFKSQNTYIVIKY
jgi:uncharacterized membrane protein